MATTDLHHSEYCGECNVFGEVMRCVVKMWYVLWCM